ncbi:hypothetical protein LX32DRAFT_412361 [Colletotrichum zoysiae]|uniref:Uncharacterized protein n=1 Tax=Colletotrichum zoysiae TaxID=1216348 RepID=A0AAD9HHA6_9PEZI|nr:hypothetical protein LX32DRAFT_412361 [Colletotrichum zoysiae]
MCISWSLLCPFILVSIPVPHQAAYRATNRRIELVIITATTHRRRASRRCTRRWEEFGAAQVHDLHLVDLGRPIRPVAGKVLRTVDPKDDEEEEKGRGSTTNEWSERGAAVLLGKMFIDKTRDGGLFLRVFTLRAEQGRVSGVWQPVKSCSYHSYSSGPSFEPVSPPC